MDRSKYAPKVILASEYGIRQLATDFCDGICRARYRPGTSRRPHCSSCRVWEFTQYVVKEGSRRTREAMG